MRFALWYTMCDAAVAVLVGLVCLIAYLRSPRPDLLFGAFVGPVTACANLALWNVYTVLRVEPHRIVSGFGQGSTVVPLGPYDRLVARDRRLLVLRHPGHWEEVPLWTFLLNRGDWEAFEAAVAERWPASPINATPAPPG